MVSGLRLETLLILIELDREIHFHAPTPRETYGGGGDVRISRGYKFVHARGRTITRPAYASSARSWRVKMDFAARL